MSVLLPGQKHADAAELALRQLALLYLGERAHASSEEALARARIENEARQELAKARLLAAYASLHHQRVPVLIGASPNHAEGELDPRMIPLGMDEGMVRLAEDTGRTLAKTAGMGGELLSAVGGLGGALGQTGSRVGGELAKGQWKWKVPALAGIAGAGALGMKGIQGTANALSQEPRVARYGGAGGYRLPNGVNEYGYPTLGTPLY